jgi:cytochrome c-type biogenesis protein CcmH/NrfG
VIAASAAALTVWLSGASVEGVSSPCWDDPAALALEAESLIAGTGSVPIGEALAQARRLYRRVRQLAPSSAGSLRAADLAAAAGDLEQAGDLLAEAAEMDPSLLSETEQLLLALRAEERGRWGEAISRYEGLRQELESEGENVSWITARIDRLDVARQAQAIAPPSSSPSPEARLALADGERAVREKRWSEAREKLTLALRLSADYVEALIALGILETQQRHPGKAIQAYRAALRSEPDNFEALAGLANLLWAEPDRRGKEESLELLDRACALRPDALSLLRVSATRWGEWGDAGRALERLDRYREKASARERRDTDDLRETFARRARGLSEETLAAASPLPESSVIESPALEPWRKAQVYYQRGDAASLDAALTLLADAEKRDPDFSRAPELAAAIHEKRQEWPAAESAWRRAIRAEPSRSSSYERLGLLLARDPRRSAEAQAVWRKADDAGSPEAVFYLAQAAWSAGDSRQALSLLQRYRNESPSGVHAEQAAALREKIEGQVRDIRAAVTAAAVLAVITAAVILYRRFCGRTLEQWLTRDPGAAFAARPIVGRLRHEVLKHGGLLLADAAARLESSDPSVRRDAASLLMSRLYGVEASGSGSKLQSAGLVAETQSAVRELESLAREMRARLNLARRDPYFSRLRRGLVSLAAARAHLEKVRAEDPGAPEPSRGARAAASRLRAAVDAFRGVSGEALERIVNRSSSIPVRLEALEQLLKRVALEARAAIPQLEVLREFPGGSENGLPSVRIAALDWETIWRNLFANALAAGKAVGLEQVHLGLSAERRRDPVTGQAQIRLALADNIPGTLTSAMISGRAAHRGWGIVSELVRRQDGWITVGPGPEGFQKEIVLDFPSSESSP